MSSSNPNAQRTNVPGPHRTLASNPNTQRTNVPGPHRTLQRRTDQDEESENMTLPSNPANPFPYVQNRSWAGIPPDTWIEMHTGFLSENTEFQKENLDETGRPKVCVQMWNNVLTIKTRMKQREPRSTDRPNFRNRLEEIVRRAGFVDQAVCLALGQFHRVGLKWKNAFMHQLAFFLALREMLEEKQGNKIPMVFQDPGFKASEEYVLSTLAGGKVVEHPEALDYITGSCFVFGPFIQHNVFGSTMLLKRPVLYIGNRIENEYSHPMGRELARRYIRKAYITADHTFGLDMQEFVGHTDAFHNYYKQEVLNDHYGELVSAFRNLFVHHPKEPHPEPVSSNESAFNFAAVKSVSTEPSIRHLTASSDAMSSASDDTALSSIAEHLCVNPNANTTNSTSESTLESSQGESSRSAHSIVPALQPAQSGVGLEGSIYASTRRGSLDPRNFPYRNKTDKVQGRWSPKSR